MLRAGQGTLNAAVHRNGQGTGRAGLVDHSTSMKRPLVDPLLILCCQPADQRIYRPLIALAMTSR